MCVCVHQLVYACDMCVHLSLGFEVSSRVSATHTSKESRTLGLEGTVRQKAQGSGLTAWIKLRADGLGSSLKVQGWKCGYDCKKTCHTVSDPECIWGERAGNLKERLECTGGPACTGWLPCCYHTRQTDRIKIFSLLDPKHLAGSMCIQ